MALQFRRGTDSDRLTITPTAGEPIWTTDTEKLYVGDGSTAGGIKVGNDSAEINVIIQNKLGNVSGNIIPDTDSAYDLGSPTNKFKDLYLSGNSIYLGDNLILRNDAGTLVAEDSSATPVSISLSNNTTSDLAEGTNLYYTTARADSDAKNAISASGDLTYNSATGAFSVTTYKSADFNTDLGTKTTADLTEGSNLYFTNARADARVTATADSAYVQARQIKYTNADFADSSFVTTQINNLIDGAPGTLDTLNEIAAALNDDDSAYSTLVGLINAKSDLDSTDAIALIDSAYVQARQTTGTDSAAVIALIDSAYVQVRQVNPVSSFTTISVNGQSDVVADGDAAGANWLSSTETQVFGTVDSVSNQQYGRATAISNNGLYAAIAAPVHSSSGGSTGRVYVYYNNGSSWSLQQTLQVPSADLGNIQAFGYSVALDTDGDTLVIGANESTSLDSNYAYGKAYVYTRSGTTWSLQQSVSASKFTFNQAQPNFGADVDISEDGNLIIVGWTGAIVGPAADQRRLGGVDIFSRSGSTWSHVDLIEESVYQLSSSSEIGENIQLATETKDRIVFSARGDQSAWVWVNSGSWARESQLTPSTTPSSTYGYNATINATGTVAAVTDRGNESVYIFTRSGSTWTEQQVLTNATASTGDLFGTTINLSGDGTRIFIGVPKTNVSPTAEGEVQIWKNTSGTWALESTVNSSDTTTSQNNYFTEQNNTVDVTKDGQYLLVGARFANTNGSAYLYTAGSGTALNDTLTLEAGSGITITTNASTDTITIAADSSIDSAGTIALIDSAYVQARQTTYDFLDSSEAIALIDSAYVQARQTTYDFLDSSEAIALIDSAYVQVRQVNPVSSFTTISVNGQSDVVADNSEAVANWSQGTQQAKVTASDGATGQNFGDKPIKASADGNIVIVPDLYRPLNSYTLAGGVYIYTRSGSTWTEAQILDAGSDVTANSYLYGYNCDISADGNTIAVSAVPTGANGSNEVIYVYNKSGSTWTLQQKFSGTGVVSGDRFGDIVSLSDDGNTLMVTATLDDDTASNAGAVYVFTRSGSTWTQQQKFQSSDVEASDFFGSEGDISGDGNTIIVGCSNEDTTANNAGSAYIFTLSGSTWSQQAKIQAGDAAANLEFGDRSISISTDGNTAAIAATNSVTDANAGAVYIFTRSGSTWSQQAKLVHPTGVAADNFSEVSISGDGNTVIIGSRGEDDIVQDGGTAFVFTRSGSTWTQVKQLYGSDITATFSYFGKQTAISRDGNTIFVSSAKNGSTAEGAVYVFTAPVGNPLQDVLTLEAGSGITITTNATTDTITIAAESSLDSAEAIALIDSAYVQARQIKYTNADFADSAFVTTQINNLIDAAPGALDTLNELAAAIGDDANFSTTITNQIAGKLDSAQTTALIDSAYVQARQTTGTDSAATISLIQANSVDSAEVISLIDSAYVAARTTAGTDSAAIINLIDSAYVAARTTAGTDSAAIINLIDSAYVQTRQVYSSDILLQIDSDLTTTDSAQIVHSFNKSTYRTVKYTAQLENDATSSYHAEEILLTHDGTNIAISSYSKLTLDSDLGEFDAQITGNNVELTLTPTNANTHVKLRAIAMSEGAANSNGLIIAVDSDLTTTDSAQTIHTFDKTNFRTMKYVAQLAVASSGDYHAQEILLTHNGTNVALTGYAKILLDSDLGTFDALINGNNVELKVSPTKANTNVKLRAIRTLA